MPRRNSNLNSACSKGKLGVRVKRSHESEEQIAARNIRLCARLTPIKEGRPVKIFTDNSVEIIFTGRPSFMGPNVRINGITGFTIHIIQFLNSKILIRH